MSRLDDLLIRAKELASAAGAKAHEVAELTKLRLQVAQLRSDLDSNYLKMGEIIYELKKANVENQELIDMCIVGIDAQHMELEELNEKIDELNKEVKCSECMASNSREALYCSRCGAALSIQKREPAEVIQVQTYEEENVPEEDQAGVSKTESVDGKETSTL